MKKRIILIMIMSMWIVAYVFAQNMQIDGGLSVTGEINSNNQRITNVGTPIELTDAVNTEFLQNALRNEILYEYKLIPVKMFISNHANNTNYIKYGDLGGPNPDTDFEPYLNILSSQGWVIDNIVETGMDQYSSQYYYSFITVILKRRIEE